MDLPLVDVDSVLVWRVLSRGSTLCFSFLFLFAFRLNVVGSKYAVQFHHLKAQKTVIRMLDVRMEIQTL